MRKLVCETPSSRRLRVGLAMMVKTPGVSSVKTRLAKGVGVPMAEAFYLSAISVLTSTLESAMLRCAAGVDEGVWAKNLGVELHPHFAVMEKSELANPLWAQFPVVWQGEGGLGEKLDTVYAALLKAFDGVILIGSDMPHLEDDILVSTAVALGKESGTFHVGPTDDGGFYLFAGNTPVPRAVWTAVPYSTSDTCAALEKALAPQGPVERLAPNFDVDEEPDLARVRRDFRSLVARAPALRAFETEGWFHAAAQPPRLSWENAP